MNQGTLMRTLRCERGLTQTQLAQGLSTRSTLGSFELRNTELSSSLLIKYLDRLNVNLAEFEFMLNDQRLSKKELVENLFLALSDSTPQEVVDFEHLLNKLYTLSEDNYYLLMLAQTKILNDYRKSIKDDNLSEEISLIKNHIFKVENWCHFELTLFNNVLFIFSNEEICVLFEKIILKMLLLKDKPRFNSLVSSFLINGCFLGFERENLNLTLVFLNTLEKLTKYPRWFEAKAYFLIFESLLRIFFDETIDICSMNKGLNVFDVLCPEKSGDLRSFIFEFLKKNNYIIPKELR